MTARQQQRHAFAETVRLALAEGDLDALDKDIQDVRVETHDTITALRADIAGLREDYKRLTLWIITGFGALTTSLVVFSLGLAVRTLFH